MQNNITTPSEVRYIVVDERYAGISRRDLCDSLTEVFTTPEEANSRADQLWYHLTRFEKKRAHIYAAVVRKEWLCDSAFDDGDIDWTSWISCDSFPSAFDSDNE